MISFSNSALQIIPFAVILIHQILLGIVVDGRTIFEGYEDRTVEREHQKSDALNDILQSFTFESPSYLPQNQDLWLFAELCDIVTGSGNSAQGGSSPMGIRLKRDEHENVVGLEIPESWEPTHQGTFKGADQYATDWWYPLFKKRAEYVLRVFREQNAAYLREMMQHQGGRRIFLSWI